MRRHQANEAKATDAGDAGGGEQHRREKAQQGELLQTYPEADGRAVAEQRRIGGPGGQKKDHRPG